MTWGVAYCTGRDEEIARTTVSNDDELFEWATQVEMERGLPRSVFSQKQYINTPALKQWGTGHWWIAVANIIEEGETDSEVSVDGRQVPARVLDRREGSGPQAAGADVPVPGRQAHCPHCGGGLT